jgi:putative nucleotidyltransferase with HDIG domain
MRVDISSVFSRVVRCASSSQLELALVEQAVVDIASVRCGEYALLDHSVAVAATSERLARALGVDRRTRTLAFLGGLLHDAGKTRTRHEVLFKRGALTLREREHMREHPVDGRSIVADIGYREISDVVLHHHELFDGTGYPLGLRGSQIPLLARVVGVADYYEALLENRPYRNGFPRAEARRMLVWASETGKLDPSIARIMCGIASRTSRQTSTVSGVTVG